MKGRKYFDEFGGVKGRKYFDEFGGEADEGDYNSNLPEEPYNVLPRSRRSATRPSGDYDYDDPD